MQLLVVNPPDSVLPEGTSELVEDFGWEVTAASSYRDAIATAGSGAVDAILIAGPGPTVSMGAHGSAYAQLLDHIDAARIAGVVLGDGVSGSRPGSLVDVVEPSISLAELRGRLAMIDRFHQHYRRIEGELARVERLSQRLTHQFQEVDQELRVAGRLQRDFLPDLDESIGDVQFASVYRPASWVSGDMFDVFKIDEDHTGFYLADAVGHGMAASLLTMFIKRALVSRRGGSDCAGLLDPSEALCRINEALTAQDLPQCQFVTACYGVLNHRTRVLRHARGGHPYPVLVSRSGGTRDLKSKGSLLGIFETDSFVSVETQLEVGDKVLLYSDGIELALGVDGAQGRKDAGLHELLQPLAGLSIGSMLERLELAVDSPRDAQAPRDDVTMLGLEILR